MKPRQYIDLILIGTISLLLIPAVVFLPSNISRIVLGVPFVLFFPGYALMAALFPARNRLSAVERLAYSLALSAALVMLLGLLLNYAWSISLYPILISLESVTFVTLSIAWLRRRNLPEDERGSFRWPWHWDKLAAMDKLLAVLLVLALLGVGWIAGYVAVKNIQPYTEFYLLGAGGKAENYPQKLGVGQEGQLTLVLANHERNAVAYTIKITQENGHVAIDGQERNEISVMLADRQKQSYLVAFAFDAAGEGQKLEFNLFRAGEAKPYLQIYLKVDVT